MYNPLTDKKPYGGVAVGQKVTFKFPLNSTDGVERVFVIFRKDDREIREQIPFAYSDGGEDFYVGDYTLDESGIWHYRFEGELKDGGIAFFGRDFDGRAKREDWLPEWQLTVSKTAYKTPKWFTNGIVYHIFADRFCKGENRAFVKKGVLHSSWEERPFFAKEGCDYQANDFFGGDVQGIIDKLDYLVSLGVGCIYLSPIFKSSSNHRYDTGDYMQVDELFGDEEQLKRLVNKAHDLGIGVILDGVFNHTGADSVYFNKFGNYPSLGAYQSKDSQYYDWYYFNEYPQKYGCWWGSTVVPTVNKSAEGYLQLVLGENGVISKWQKLGIDGWRLDVVDELPIDFTYALCGKIKEINENAVIIGEVWEDASTKTSYDEWRPYFMGGQLDGVMNYPFKRAIIDFLLGGDAKKTVWELTSIMENYPKQSLDCCMTLLGSHDTVRILTALSGAPAPNTKAQRDEFRLDAEQFAVAKHRLKLASVLQYTLPGVPTVYYGDEVGMQGFEDPLNRATYPWGKEDEDILAHYRVLGGLRVKYPELFMGETVFLSSDDALEFERRSSTGILTVKVSRDGAVIYVDGEKVFNYSE